jgi:hypothetical protein
MPHLDVFAAHAQWSRDIQTAAAVTTVRANPPRHRCALVSLSPAMATVHPPPQFALLQTNPPRAGADVPGNDSDSESVAESRPRRAAATDSCGFGTCCRDEEVDDDDDGCSSCVEGDECSSYQYQEAQDDETAADDDEGGVKAAASSSVWWERMAAARTFPLPAPARLPEVEEGPERAAERQEEDRKFWEDCLATGYP